MKKYSVATAAIALVMISGAALAADLPRRSEAPPPPAPIFTQQPAFTWTGFYAGISGGGAFGRLGRGSNDFGSANGGLVGGTVGYNYQVNNMFVVGLEGDMSWAGMTGNHTLPGPIFMRAKMNSFATVRARAGVVAFDRTLLYITGGYAGGNINSTITDTTVPAAYSANSWRNGWVIGGGVEYAINRNISAKAEYLYTQVGSNNNGGTLPTVSNAGYRGSIIRAGLNYRF